MYEINKVIGKDRKKENANNQENFKDLNMNE